MKAVLKLIKDYFTASYTGLKLGDYLTLGISVFLLVIVVPFLINASSNIMVLLGVVILITIGIFLSRVISRAITMFNED